jgi:hypothetical protein
VEHRVTDIDFSRFVDARADMQRAEVYVQVGVRDPESDRDEDDCVYAEMRGTLEPIALRSDHGSGGRGVAWVGIGEQREGVRRRNGFWIDRARFRWGKEDGGIVKAQFDDIRITVGSRHPRADGMNLRLAWKKCRSARRRRACLPRARAMLEGMV